MALGRGPAPLVGRGFPGRGHEAGGRREPRRWALPEPVARLQQGSRPYRLRFAGARLQGEPRDVSRPRRGDPGRRHPQQRSVVDQLRPAGGETGPHRARAGQNGCARRRRGPHQGDHRRGQRSHPPGNEARRRAPGGLRSGEADLHLERRGRPARRAEPGRGRTGHRLLEGRAERRRERVQLAGEGRPLSGQGRPRDEARRRCRSKPPIPRPRRRGHDRVPAHGRASRQVVRRPARAPRRLGPYLGRRGGRPPRTERRRQDHDVLHDRRPRHARRGPRRAERRRRDRSADVSAGARRHQLSAAGSVGLPQAHRRRKRARDTGDVADFCRGTPGTAMATPRGAQHRASGKDQGICLVGRRTASARDHASARDLARLHAAGRAVCGHRPDRRPRYPEHHPAAQRARDRRLDH